MKTDYEGFAGNVYVSASNKSAPLIIDSDTTELTAQHGRPYAGCYVNASIDIYAQDNQYGKRINAMLRAVQFAGHGEAFGGSAPASASEFADISSTVPAAGTVAMGAAPSENGTPPPAAAVVPPTAPQTTAPGAPAPGLPPVPPAI